MELYNLQKARSFESLGLTTLKSVSGVVSEAYPKASSNATPLKARAKASVVAALVVFLTCLACLVAANAQPAKTAWAEGGEGAGVVNGTPAAAARANATERTNIAITESTIQDQNGTTPEALQQNRWYSLKLAWDASAYGNTLHEGDYFTVQLPEQMQFPTNHSATHFNMLAPDGSVVARAVVASNGSAGGGTVTATFTNYVEGRRNITGTMYMETRVVTEKVQMGQVNHLIMQVGASVATLDVVVQPTTETPLNPEETLSKWYSRSGSTDDYVQWEARVNFAGRTLPGTVLTDELRVDEGSLDGLMFIPESFTLQERRFDEYGHTTWHGELLDAAALAGRLSFSEYGTRFTLDLGDLDGQAYLLRYRSTYRPGVKLANVMRLESNEAAWVASSSFVGASSGGSGSGVVVPEEPEPGPEPEPEQPGPPEDPTPETPVAPTPPAQPNMPALPEVPELPELPDLPIAPQPSAPTSATTPAKQTPRTIPNTGDCIIFP